jgi:hypothetical protein
MISDTIKIIFCEIKKDDWNKKNDKKFVQRNMEQWDFLVSLSSKKKVFKKLRKKSL